MATFPRRRRKGTNGEKETKEEGPRRKQEGKDTDDFPRDHLFVLFHSPLSNISSRRSILGSNMVHVLSLTISLFCLFRSQQFVLSIEAENEVFTILIFLEYVFLWIKKI